MGSFCPTCIFQGGAFAHHVVLDGGAFVHIPEPTIHGVISRDSQTAQRRPAMPTVYHKRFNFQANIAHLPLMGMVCERDSPPTVDGDVL